MNFIKKKGLGIGLCIVLAAIATLLCKIQAGSFSFEIIGAPVFGILMGMIITLICPKLAANETLKDGIKFTSKKILQWAVIILGFSLNLGTIAGGWSEKSSGHCVYHHYFFVSGNVDDESTPYGQAYCLSDRSRIFHLRWIRHCRNRTGD